MTADEFAKLHSLRTHQKPSKASEAARRVLVLGEPQIVVAKALGISRGNVSEAQNTSVRQTLIPLSMFVAEHTTH